MFGTHLEFYSAKLCALFGSIYSFIVIHSK